MKSKCAPTFLVCILAACAATAGQNKKLIEFGWDEPDTGFLRSNIVQVQKTAFDGCVFHVDYRKGDGKKGSFTWESWGTNAFTDADVAEAFKDLKSIKWGSFKWSFLRFNTSPAKTDWFDDHSAVMANARLAARLARAGKCPGILFDIEQYEGPLFNYRKQRDAKTRSWEIYAAQVRLRGREVMRAFQEEYPEVTVFLTFGYSLPWVESAAGRGPLADCNYGLLAPFLDGMVEVAGKRTRFVDGYELSYGYKTAAEYQDARKKMTGDLLPIVQNPARYRQLFSLGFGVWMDRDWRKFGWNTEDFSKNYFTPETFEQSVTAALKEADEYVWIYSESPRWWSPGGGPVKLPAAYDNALRKARNAGAK